MVRVRFDGSGSRVRGLYGFRLVDGRIAFLPTGGRWGRERGLAVWMVTVRRDGPMSSRCGDVRFVRGAQLDLKRRIA